MNDRLEQLTKMYQADSKDPFCTYGIAMEHAKADRHDDAITWLDRTLDIDNHYCYAFYQKAKILSAKGDTDAASEILRAGMETARAVNDQHALSEMGELLSSIE